jgi:hypothetical protein
VSDPTPAHRRVLEQLRDEVADRVRERAAILHEACPGLTWEQADLMAFEQETVRR